MLKSQLNNLTAHAFFTACENLNSAIIIDVRTSKEYDLDSYLRNKIILTEWKT